VECGGLLASVAGLVGGLGEVVPPGQWVRVGGVRCCVKWEREASMRTAVELRELRAGGRSLFSRLIVLPISKEVGCGGTRRTGEP